MTPEEMVRAYDTLELADVYTAIGHSLRYRDDVQASLKQRREEATELGSTIEAARPGVPRGEWRACQGVNP